MGPTGPGISHLEQPAKSSATLPGEQFWTWIIWDQIAL